MNDEVFQRAKEERLLLKILKNKHHSWNQLWRIKTNNELNKLIKHQNMVNYVKALRLSWFGLVQRMPDLSQEDFQMDASNYKTQRKTQAKMGRQCNTGYSSTEHQKVDSLCPRSCKMEKRR